MRKIFELQAWTNDSDEGQRPSAELIVHRWTDSPAMREKVRKAIWRMRL
jgi:hypothetical protein